jgi:hypothetical protein
MGMKMRKYGAWFLQKACAFQLISKLFGRYMLELQLLKVYPLKKGLSFAVQAEAGWEKANIHCPSFHVEICLFNLALIDAGVYYGPDSQQHPLLLDGSLVMERGR